MLTTYQANGNSSPDWKGHLQVRLDVNVLFVCPTSEFLVAHVKVAQVAFDANTVRLFFFKGLQERHWFFPQMNISFKLWILHEMIPSWGKTLWPEVVTLNSGDLMRLMKGIKWYPSQVFHGRNHLPVTAVDGKSLHDLIRRMSSFPYIPIAAGFLPSASLISSKCLDSPSLKIQCT